MANANCAVGDVVITVPDQGMVPVDGQMARFHVLGSPNMTVKSDSLRKLIPRFQELSFVAGKVTAKKQIGPDSFEIEISTAKGVTASLAPEAQKY